MVHKFEDEEPLFLPPFVPVSFVVVEVQSEKDCLLVPEGKKNRNSHFSFKFMLVCNKQLNENERRSGKYMVVMIYLLLSL